LKYAFDWGGVGPNDFMYFWEAGRAVLTGGEVNKIWFPYPPHALFLYVPFALLPFLASWAVYNLYGLALFMLAARNYLPKGFPPILILCTPAVLFCVLYGQTGLIVGALWLWAFQGKWQAVALLTFKPHIGVLSALSLNRKTLLPTVALAGVLILASAVVFSDWWTQFFSQIVKQSATIGHNTKWPYVAVGPAIGYGFAGWAVFAAAALYLLSRHVDAFSAATAALLVSPYGFHYDMPAASVGFALALHKEESASRTLGLAVALMLPVLVRLFGAWIAPPVLLWALWAQTAGRGANASPVSFPMFRRRAA
jgi:alpha-1,2-mannosyltransferase